MFFRAKDANDAIDIANISVTVKAVLLPLISKLVEVLEIFLVAKLATQIQYLRQEVNLSLVAIKVEGNLKVFPVQHEHFYLSHRKGKARAVYELVGYFYVRTGFR